MAKEKKRHVIGVDLGGTKILVALLDREYNVLARNKKRTRDKKGGGNIFKRMVGLIGKTLEENGLGPGDLLGIAIGTPGPLNPFTGVLGLTPNLAWENFPIRDKVKEAFGVPVVALNDVNAGTYAEVHFGAAHGARNVLGCFPGTGIGGAVIVDGKVQLGATGITGEIGHICIDPGGVRCGCGARGCVEAYAGRRAIAAKAWLAVQRGDAPHLLAEAGADPAAYRSGALARAIEAGDAAVEEIVADAARLTGRVLAGLVNTLSPGCIVLGGGLVEAMPQLYLGEIDRTIRELALPDISAGVKVVEAALGDDAVVMGAARFLIKPEGKE
jgi:glucokinase